VLCHIKPSTQLLSFKYLGSCLLMNINNNNINNILKTDNWYQANNYQPFNNNILVDCTCLLGLILVLHSRPLVAFASRPIPRIWAKISRLKPKHGLNMLRSKAKACANELATDTPVQRTVLCPPMFLLLNQIEIKSYLYN